MGGFEGAKCRNPSRYLSELLRAPLRGIIGPRLPQAIQKLLRALCDALRASIGVARDGIRQSLLGATVIVASDEQPDASRSGHQEPLRRFPSLSGMKGSFLL